MLPTSRNILYADIENHLSRSRVMIVENRKKAWALLDADLNPYIEDTIYNNFYMLSPVYTFAIVIVVYRHALCVLNK
jgi:hypothetical protein